MSTLPQTENQLAYLTPSVQSDRFLFDRMGCLTCVLENDSLLRLRGKLNAGYYQMSMSTRKDSFDKSTLMLPFTEWPSMRTGVPTGPFDFDHTTYNMVVPTFRTTVNGFDWGLVWCEVPSPEDLKNNCLYAMWGFEVVADGDVEIVLEVSPENRYRLRFSDIAELDLRPDNRYRLSLEGISTEIKHPRVLATKGSFDHLRNQPDSRQKAWLERMKAQTEVEDHGSYEFKTIVFAFLGRLTGEQHWTKEAIKRTLELCGKDYWGYHDTREVMGWNNDRDAGNRMFETAVVYDWFYDILTPEQRQIIEKKLAYQANIAYKVTVLQKNYWYYRCVDAHGMGLWNGFASAAAALLGHDSRAPVWLSWAMGNLDDALRHMPEDGLIEWPTFNAFWHILHLAVIEKLLGHPMKGPHPFLDALPGNIISTPQMTSHGKSTFLSSMLLFLANRSKNPNTQAAALAGMDFSDPSRHRRCLPFEILFYDPKLEPTTFAPPCQSLRSLGGEVFCTGQNDVRFGFRSGSPATAKFHNSLNWINTAWYNIQCAGGFEWVARRSLHVPYQINSYRHRTSYTNAVTIDGVGHYLEERYIGTHVPIHRLPFIESYHYADDVTYCCGNLTPAYADTAEVLHSSRTWIFLHKFNLVVMVDRLQTARPKSFAWHIHGYRSMWEKLSPLCYKIVEGDHKLTARALYHSMDGQGVPLENSLTATTMIQERIPWYTTGMNRYKSMEWQPELYKEKPDVIPNPDLQFAANKPASKWELITIMGVDTDLVEKAEIFESKKIPGVKLGKAGQVLCPAGELLKYQP